MKFVFTLFFMIAFSVNAKCQNFMQVGSEWNYKSTPWENPSIGTNTCQITGDTLIDGKNCLIFVQDHENCNGRPKVNYLYPTGDSILFYDEPDSSFKLLYDFSLEVGDTMTFETGIHSWSEERYTILMRVDSIQTFPENSIDLKYFHVTYGFYFDDTGFYFENGGATIIEGIGSTDNFFHVADATGYCHNRYTKGLRCFSSPSYPLVKFSQEACVTVANIEIDADLDFQLYPNPFANEIQLRSKEIMSNHSVMIYDMLGKVVSKNKLLRNESYMNISLQGLKPSMYIITVLDDSNKVLFSKKIVKQ